MMPNVWMDVRLRPGMGVTVPVLAGLAVQAAHGVMARHPDTVALLFPKMISGQNPTPGFCIRLFAQDVAAITAVAEAVCCPALAGCMEPGGVQRVSTPWSGSIVCCERFRIPARAGRGTPAQLEKRQRLRHKRLAEARMLPFLRVYSASTQQTVTLTLRQGKSTGAELGGCPDAYGLSRPSHTVWLPDLDV